jgi:GTPase SAR1 and related small G proteins
MGAKQAKQKLDSSSKIKLLLMGKPGVGKSSLISYYQNNEISRNYEPTSGCKLISLNVNYYETNYHLLVMDSLADSDLGLSCRLKSVQNAEIIAIVFDLTNPET